ncbi:MAG: hypothetical protein E6I52_18285 [Chloroflexi bacterium]|nr:MAG: hypothetical protein E6I52_18285 [Chloroflexota bacterium]
MATRVGFLLALLALAAIACARPQPAGPTPVPEPPSVRPLAGRGIQVDGHGTTQTDDLTPQYASGPTIGIDVVTLSHDGRSSFIVTAVQGGQSELLTSAIGTYRGQRPLVVEGPVSFQVTADGAWSLKLEPLSNGGTPAFSGTGDMVSAYFTPPGSTTWNITHDGQTSFFVYAHCVGGSIVVEDRSGNVKDAPRVEFPRGPCFWEVRADGAWSLQPGQ